MNRDRRLITLDRTIEEHDHHRNALLEILQKAQELYGYLDLDVMTHISKELRLPPSHVYGAATFYNFFRLQEPGQHIITPCLGTACYVKGVDDIVLAIENEYDVKRGDSTSDGRLSLFVTRCIGACAQAPNVVVDGQVMGKVKKEDVLKRIEDVLGGEGE
ncbi:MAG: NAD(P)H-dependent oxidoreductase subunit E [Methanomassiliicoccales archaeon]|nr:NAD(P)H-dependent oxidoreductase subunit E [Methanomassiliicoccales archaeon]NYT14615.1 NAD(P)H-dependent oxidoreductase subunit E [Methanomassiliicoccales archaeon]